MELSARSVFASLERYLLQQTCPSTLHDLQRAVLEKGVRSLDQSGHWPIVDFPLAIHRVLGGAAEMGIGVGGACALFYAFADITDDAEDHDLLPEPWLQWGWEQAVNTGTSLLFLSLGFARDHLPKPIANAVIEVFVGAGLEMTYGQHTDLIGQRNPNMVLKDYLLMVERKSGASFGAYAQAAAAANSRDRDQCRQFWEFGQTLGVMFQMVSDVYELWSPLPSPDYKNQRWSLPIVLGFERANGEVREQLVTLLAAPKESQQADLISLLEVMGVRGYATMRIEVYRRKARALAAELGVDSDRYIAELMGVSAFPATGIAV